MEEDAGISTPGRVSCSPLSSHMHAGPPLGLCSHRSLSRPHLWTKSFRYHRGGQSCRGCGPVKQRALDPGPAPWPQELRSLTPWTRPVGSPRRGSLSRAEHVWQAWATAGGEPGEAGGRQSVRAVAATGEGSCDLDYFPPLLLPSLPPTRPVVPTTPLGEPCPRTGPPASCPGPLPG